MLQTLLVMLLSTVGLAGAWPLRDLPVTSGGNEFALSVNITSYGAVGDGKSDCTAAFQHAMAALDLAGGGTLVVPHTAGSGESIYLTHPLRFNTSHVTLHLEENTRVKAICDIDGWPVEAPWPSFGGQSQYVPYVHVANASDFVLEGAGTLDGNGSCFWGHQQGHHTDLKYQRPRLLVIEAVSRVFVSGVTITNSPFWCAVFYNSQDVHVSGVTIVNPSGGKGPCPQPDGEACFGPNADGIDLVSVERALIENSHITAGDDCVCIKSGTNQNGRAVHRPATDILVRNMTLHSCSCPHVFKGFADGCGGMKVGTEMSGDVSNVLFEDSTIQYAGIALKLSAPLPRGGSVSNITWRSVAVENAGMLLNIEDGNSGKSSTPPKPEEVPRVSGVSLIDVSLANSSCLRGVAKGSYGCGLNAGWVLAGNTTPLHGLTLRNVSSFGGSGQKLAWKCSGKIEAVQMDAVDPPATCLLAGT